MKVNDMDKYQVTEKMKKLKKRMNDPATRIIDLPIEVYDQVNNPVTDKDGYIHKYYLTDEVKSLIEMFSSINKI